MQKICFKARKRIAFSNRLCSSINKRGNGAYKYQYVIDFLPEKIVFGKSNAFL